MSQPDLAGEDTAHSHASQALVLVVDDNPVNQKVLDGVLSKAGFGVVKASSGLAALDLVARHKFDLVLLDVMMPDMDGYEVCRILKQNPCSRDLPVIFLTAKSEINDVVTGFESGGVDYVTKPFQALELLARVRTHIELKRAREEIRTLRGIVPVCASCGSVRDDKGAWQTLENYVRSHSDAEFSHGFCPTCLQKLYPDVADRISKDIQCVTDK